MRRGDVALPPIYGESMSNWRANGKTALVVVVVFLLVQLAVPISRLHPRETPHRWAWQMFSRSPHSVQFIVHTPTGSTEVDVSQYMSVVRGDIDLTTAMPMHLCSVHDDAVRITWETEELEC